MTAVRTATCQCGAVRVACTGEPVRISLCHCLDCQKRSGSVFAVQARFPADNVTITGETRTWWRAGDEGMVSDHYFCPTCGSDVAFVARDFPDTVAVPVGAFADPGAFPAPWVEVYEERKFSWVEVSLSEEPGTPQS